MAKRSLTRFGLSLTALALVAVLAAWGLRAPATAQAPITLKMQATSPASLTLYDNFKMFAERVEKLSAGRLKIETLPAGAIVPAFEVLDATNKKVIDGAHAWAAYWVGKNKTAVLFTGGPGGTFGMDFIDYVGWMYGGGGLQLYQEFNRDVLKLNVIPIPILPSGPQAFGCFKRPFKTLADFNGMKCRQTGMAAEVYTAMGMTVVNMPVGEIIPSAQRGRRCAVHEHPESPAVRAYLMHEGDGRSGERERRCVIRGRAVKEVAGARTVAGPAGPET